MRPHDVVAPVCTPSTAPSPCRRRASGQRAATPPAAIGSRPARGTVRHPLGGLFLGPFREPVPPWKCRHPAESSGRSRPGEQFRHPLGRLFFNPGFASRRRGRHACRGKLWTQSVRGTVRHPLGGLFLPARPGCRIPPCRPRVLTHPIRYPTASLISIGSGCRSTAGP